MKLKKKTQKAKPQREQGSNSFWLPSIVYKQVSLLAHLFLFVSIPLSCFSQADGLNWSRPISQAHELILQYKLNEAESVLNKLPDSPVKAYLLNLGDFMRMVYSEDYTVYQKYLEAREQRTEWIERLPNGDAEKAFYLADLKLQEALFKIRFGDYLSGLYALWQAQKQMTDFAKLDGQILPFLKPKGIVNILIGLTPDKYKWAINLAGFKGDAETGITELTKLSESEGPMHDEALIILGYLYAYPLQSPHDAIDCFTKVLKKHPESLLAKFMLATSMNKAHQGDSAISILEKLKREEMDRLPNIYYLMGDVYLQRGSFGLAKNNYQRFIDTYKGKGFKKDAFTKIAVCYQLEGNTSKAELWKEKASNHEQAVTEPDKNAEVLLSELSTYPAGLLKARLLTDGGYWDSAQEALQSINDPEKLTARWSSEYYYRKARLSHLEKNFNEANTDYERALSIADQQPWYIGANAALQLGIIYKGKGMNSEAVVYFKKAKEFDNHPYKSSIDSKADLELRQMGLK